MHRAYLATHSSFTKLSLVVCQPFSEQESARANQVSGSQLLISSSLTRRDHFFLLTTEYDVDVENSGNVALSSLLSGGQNVAF
jgi:hypothetical protein